jgi:hypothetical protein
MVHSMGRRQWPTVVLGLASGLLLIAMGALPALAAGVPFTGWYQDEVTTPRKCPPGFPAGAFCFTGVGHGPTTPPGTTGTENYAGFVDFTTHDPVTGCPVDHNAVSISTSSGTLFLTTTGSACGAFDDGTWQAFGGTGVFEDATGTGHVHTLVLGPPDPVTGNIKSSSAYTGTLNLHEGAPAVFMN